MVRRRTAARVVLVAALACAMGSPAAAQLCPPAADPCVVAADVAVDSGTVVDVGTRTFVLAAGVVLTVRSTGVLAIHARAIDLDAGARIVATGASGLGGDVTLLGTTHVDLAATSLVDVSAASGGRLAAYAPDGSVALGGEVRAFGTSRDGDGGAIEVMAGGDCDLLAGAKLRASGGDRLSLGGDVDFDCGGDVRVAGMIESKGGDGGDVQLFAGADVVVAPTGHLDMSGRNSGEGGPLIAIGGASVAFHGTLLSRGSTLVEIAGDGGDVDLVSGSGSVLLGGTIDLGGAPPDGAGGITFIDAATSAAVSGLLSAVSATNGSGGVVGIAAGTDVVLDGTIDLADGFLGGELRVQAGGAVTVPGTVAVDGAEIGGEARIEGCAVAIEASGAITNLGRAVGILAANVLLAHDVRVDGTLIAGARNELRHGGPAPTIGPGATIVPAATLVPDPTLPCCGCTTTTLPSASTTTTSFATTTTLGSTTTTMAPATTTSTEPSPSTTTSSTTSSTSPSSTSTTAVVSTSTSTTSTSNPAVEECGNCIDDDGDGLVDLADDDCCPTALPGVLRRGRVKPRADSETFKLIAQWLPVAPTVADDLQVQLLDGVGATRLCALLTVDRLRAKRRRLAFRDRTGALADGLRTLSVKTLRNETARLTLRGRSARGITDDGALEIRHRLAATDCVVTSGALRPVTRGFRAP